MSLNFETKLSRFCLLSSSKREFDLRDQEFYFFLAGHLNARQEKMVMLF